METFIKLYDWTADVMKNDERIVFCLVHQFTRDGFGGFWAGYATMSKRTGIPKSKCKRIIEKLKAENAIFQTRETIQHKTRIVFKSNPDYTAIFVK